MESNVTCRFQILLKLSASHIGSTLYTITDFKL